MSFMCVECNLHEWDPHALLNCFPLNFMVGMPSIFLTLHVVNDLIS